MPSESVRFALLGIPESVGPRANHGRPGSERAWEAFLSVFLNLQDNRFLPGSSIVCAGEVEVSDLCEEADRLDPARDADIDRLRTLCTELDRRVKPIVGGLAKCGVVPIVVGGGHNNAYPILQGCAAVSGPLQCVNCDPHADLRAREGRHSGNAFTYAMAEGVLQRYFVFGLQSGYNNESALARFEGNPDLSYARLAPGADVRSMIEAALRFLGSSTSAVGMEVDMDSICDMPASAQTPVGLRIDQVRRLLQTVTFRFRPVYLHLAEAAPPEDSAGQIRAGKVLACLTADFIEAMLTPSEPSGPGNA
jgi:formiminoglutamase